MKTFILIIIFIFTNSFLYAEKCYIYIDKIGIVEKGEKAGQNEYGDVIGIYPYTSQYKPTSSELSRYKVIIVDLTEKEKQTLIEEEGYLEGDDFITTKARKRKIDIDKIVIEQEEEITDKTVITSNLIDKTIIIVEPI